MEVGNRVIWAGRQDPRCAPGFNGTILKIAGKDPNRLKVHWDERGAYTWERRKNLQLVGDSDAGVREPRRPLPSVNGAAADVAL